MINAIGTTGYQADSANTPSRVGGGVAFVGVPSSPANERKDVPRAGDAGGPIRDSVDVAAGYVSLQSAKEQQNQKAQEVRQLGQVNDALETARKNLTQIVKTNPPYPHDDSTRMMLLEGLVGVRKLIEQLSVPPVHQEIVKTVTDLPAMKSIHASDSQVADALAHVNKVGDALTADAKKLFAGSGADGGSHVGAELSAEQKSVAVGTALGEAGGVVSTEAGKRLAQSILG